MQIFYQILLQVRAIFWLTPNQWYWLLNIYDQKSKYNMCSFQSVLLKQIILSISKKTLMEYKTFFTSFDTSHAEWLHLWDSSIIMLLLYPEKDFWVKSKKNTSSMNGITMHHYGGIIIQLAGMSQGKKFIVIQLIPGIRHHIYRHASRKHALLYS